MEPTPTIYLHHVLAADDSPKLRSQHFLDRVLVNHAELGPLKKNRHGKPYPTNPDWFLSLAHSQNEALCIVSKQPVGVDLEVVKPRSTANKIARKYFHAKEVARMEIDPNPLALFLQLWTLKEAYAKVANITVYDAMHVDLSFIEQTQLHPGTCDTQQAVNLNCRFVAATTSVGSPMAVCIKTGSPTVDLNLMTYEL